MWLASLLCFLLAGGASAVQTFERRSFTVGPDSFLLDGRPFHYVSGSVHYFKVPSAYWRDRLTRLRASGVNALQTYVQWSVHQPEEDVTDFSGQQDLVRYIQMAQELGLLVILRPGPYIDAERDLGGLPYWLLKRPGIKLRSSDPLYMDAVTAWYDELLPKIKPLLYSNGGPVIMMQVRKEVRRLGTAVRLVLLSLILLLIHLTSPEYET